MTWDFEERLSSSRNPDARARLELFLRIYFGGARDFELSFEPEKTAYGHDAEAQAFGQRYTLEIKVREKDWGDELLEDVSNDTSGRPGWTWRAGSVHYVLHVYPERIEIWPGAALELAWRQNRESWIRMYGQRRAANQGYRTVNVPVPTEVLRKALEAAGAELCRHCKRNVGPFRAQCDTCGVWSCCVVSDGPWICEDCSGKEGL